MKDVLGSFCPQRLQRTMPPHAVCVVVASVGMSCKRHKEQCALAEFSAYVVRDVIAHDDLATEARAKKPRKLMGDEDSEHESDSEASQSSARPVLEIIDVGGGNGEAFDANADAEDIPPCEVCNFSLSDICKTSSLFLQQGELAAMSSKSRKS